MTAPRRRLSVLLVLTLPCLGACQDVPTSLDREVQPPQASISKSSGLPFTEALAELGDEIFEDRNLSLHRNQSCESCHTAEWGFTGPTSAVNGVGAVYEGSIAGEFGNRKPPSSAYSTPAPLFDLTRQAGGLFVGGNFWDGRATGRKLGNPAADQAQGPFTNPKEQALRDAACVVYRVSIADYADMYEEQFGTAIFNIDWEGLDVDGLCGEQGDALPLSPAARAQVEAEYDNIAVAIAVYEESHNLFSSKFDAAMKGLYRFTPQEQRGFALFNGKAKCAKCHTSSGRSPVFTDFTYDNLGVPKNAQNPETIKYPNWSDPGLGGFLLTQPSWAGLAAGEMGKMKVPTLRNVDLRPYEGAVKAYMHNGVFKSLEEVVRFYNTRDMLRTCGMGDTRADWGTTCWPEPEVSANVNRKELGNLGLTRAEEAAIVAFLKTLSDGYIPGGRGKHLR
jgi:cytochrome c peroxidase